MFERVIAPLTGIVGPGVPVQGGCTAVPERGWTMAADFMTSRSEGDGCDQTTFSPIFFPMYRGCRCRQGCFAFCHGIAIRLSEGQEVVEREEERGDPERFGEPV